MMHTKYLSLFIIFISLLLQGCAAVVVTGAATGATVATDERTTGTFIEDQAIELKANQAIYANKEVSDATHVSITSYNTVVLLTGEAPTEELRSRIIEIINTIPKVTHVHNEISIAAPSSLMSRSSDALITSKVKTKLLADEKVKGIKIKVVTERGVVYLMGIISREEADMATELTRRTGGVQKVVKLFQYID